MPTPEEVQEAVRVLQEAHRQGKLTDEDRELLGLLLEKAEKARDMKTDGA